MNLFAGLAAAILTQVLHAALLLLAAPLVPGLVRWLRARLLGRAGPPWRQPFRDLWRALRRQPVVAENASVVFRLAPLMCFSAIAAAALMVPSFALGMASAPLADLLVIAGLLMLARCSLALAAMDVGTAFGGIGASREMAFSAYAEPALMLVILTLTLLAGSTNLDTIAGLVREGGLGLRVSLGPVLVSVVMVALADTGRIPAGNPSSHFELTMVHEATVLEYSGWHFAIIELAACLKLLLWLSLIAIFLPVGMAQAGAGPLAWAVGLAAWAGKLLVLAVALAVFENTLARMRVFRLPEFLGIAVLLGLVAALFLFFSQGFA